MAGAAGKVRWVFDVWGDTVNTAARVESHGVDGMINLTSQAWQCVADHCRGESLGEVPVKGKRCLEIVRVDDVAI
jgi:class 3 adenylate cyclase